MRNRSERYLATTARARVSSLFVGALLVSALSFVPFATTASGASASGARTTSRDVGARTTSRDVGAPTNVAKSLTVGGLTRTYLLYVPPDLSSSSKAPLLLVFHGHGETAADIASITGFDQIANRNDFIVVYPQGFKNSWNDGRGTTEAALHGVNDIAFVRALLRQLEATLPVDPDRVYATGFSNGGIFTERVGCELAGMLAGIAPVAGPIATPIARSCQPERPLPVFEIQGTSDPVVPYAGGRVSSAVGGKVLSTVATLKFWTRRDGCTTTPTRSELAPALHDGTSVEVVRFSHCADGTAVTIARVIGGVHEWPGTLDNPKSSRSTSGQAFRASPAIWRFLRQFSRAPAVCVEALSASQATSTPAPHLCLAASLAPKVDST